MEAVMQKVLFRARGSYAQDQRGNVAILFAFSMIPMIGLLGGAVDLMRHSRHEVQIQNAMDAATLALTKRGAENDADADRFVNDYISAVVPATDRMLEVDPFDATKTETGYMVSVTGMMQTAFMPVVGVQALPINLESEVSLSTQDYELALVLDNTGSMEQRGKIRDLRSATRTLLDTVYETAGSEARVKTALVPFVTGVNIKSETAFSWDWIDKDGGKWSGEIFDRPNVDRVALAEQIDAKYGWRGCVEAREQEDLEDTEPRSAETRWTPWFWPDEPDRADGYSNWNDYIEDRSNGDANARRTNSAKYDAPIWRVSSIDETSGPNKSCAGPVVELTSDKARMDAAVTAMKPHPSSGTNIAQGMVWGWRVLSPEEPFSQGVSYDDAETQKALVVLTDGKNEIGGDYTSYGYMSNGRLGSTEKAALAQMNKNVETLCGRVKEKDIRLYMIVFQENDRKTQEIFERCASVNDDGEKLYYFAPDGESLEKAFEKIGLDLTSIHISR
jgi:Flp pilus assembly protein TadG